jgi:hypothetical protein
MKNRSIAAAACLGLALSFAGPAAAQKAAPTHLDLQKSLIVWMQCTDATPQRADLEKIQLRVLEETNAPESEAEALAELELAAREMGDVVARDGCEGAEATHHMKLFDTHLAPALSE